ncbi:MAG: septal ring lytic transglycosylase RlpA family protein [Rhodothermaceae bacterium]
MILLICTGCGSSARFSSQINGDYIRNIPGPEKRYNRFSKNEVLKSFEGLASFYAHKYHGRTTSNGETYNMYELTAAHPYFPFDTIVRIINLENQKNVIVRINDRMPKHPERLIDLSLGTAKALEMVEDGVVKVRLEILRWGKVKENE